MSPWLLVAVGSALGGVSRYACGVAIAQRFGQAFPWGTLAVNVIGCFAIGALGALMLVPHRAGATIIRDFVMIGFLGGFTTFSAFSLQTFQLMRDGKIALAVANVAASVILCLIAVALGFVVASRLSHS
jgi:fluoride exporter